MYPTSPILQRTICIQTRHFLGSAFTVDVGDKLALITARHLMKDYVEGQVDEISFSTGTTFEKIKVIPHFPSSSTADITVLQTGELIDPNRFAGLELSGGHMIIGQDVYFIGFPYFGGLLEYASPELNNGFPIPLVKKACLSGFVGEVQYLDGHNNPGFSGGPVIFNAEGKQKICGVVSSFVGKPWALVATESTESEFVENLGIINSYKIELAVELLEKVYGQKPNANL